MFICVDIRYLRVLFNRSNNFIWGADIRDTRQMYHRLFAKNGSGPSAESETLRMVHQVKGLKK